MSVFLPFSLDEEPDAIYIPPPVLLELEPAIIDMSPPSSAKGEYVDPPLIFTDLPTPTFPEPTDSEISPPDPSIEEPVSNMNDPLLPVDEWPLRKETSPLVPLVPALAVCSNISPELVLVPLPDEIYIEPSIFVVFEFPQLSSHYFHLSLHFLL